MRTAKPDRPPRVSPSPFPSPAPPSHPLPHPSNPVAMASEAPPPPSSSSSARAPAGAPSPETYLGSLISLTSKSEIRYEGVLYNINAEESTIGLCNVRSFGTEWQKEDGIQLPASEKVYETMLFRGSDIKDLQVKSSPSSPPQPAAMQNDPAIIQSHYPQAASNLRTAGGAALPDLSSQPSQYGFQRQSFKSNIPLYQQGNTPWGSSGPPPAGNGAGLSAPPMYWQGYCAPVGSLPQHLQQHLPQPTPGLSAPQTFQYPGLNPSLPSGPQKQLSELQPPLLKPSAAGPGPSSSTTLATTTPSASLLGPEKSNPLLNKRDRSNENMAAGTIFVKKFYTTTGKAPQTMYMLYRDKCKVTWKIHESSYEMASSKEIEQIMAEPPSDLQVEFRLDNYVVQESRRAIHVVASGICKWVGNRGGTFVQSFVLHPRRHLIAHDVLLVKRNVPQFKIKTASTFPAASGTINDETLSVNSTDQPLVIRGNTDVKSQALRQWTRRTRKPASHNADGGYELGSSSVGKSKICIIYHPDMLKHVSSRSANEVPDRVRLIMKKLEDDGLLKRCKLLRSKFANNDDIEAVHPHKYLELVRQLPMKKKDMEKLEDHFGDVFASKGTRDAAFLAAGSVVQGCEVVLDNTYEAAFAIVRPPGHHALPEKADGFCYLNNAAIGAEYSLKKKNLQKVAVFDMDIHHGNGTQSIFYGRKDVLVFSVHSSELDYPYDAKAAINRTIQCIGVDEGLGYNINVNLRKGYTDADMMMVLKDLLLPVLNEYQPDLIIISAGYDAAKGDTLGDALLTKSCFAILVRELRKVNTGRIVLTLEGGYNLTVTAECVSYTVKSLLGDTEVLIQEDIGEPLPTTPPTVRQVKELLSGYWKVFGSESN